MSETEKNSGEANAVRDPFQDEIENLTNTSRGEHSDPLQVLGPALGASGAIKLSLAIRAFHPGAVDVSRPRFEPNGARAISC